MDILSQEGSMLLEEEIDENYEPTEEEIMEYAKYLGMDVRKDQKFFHIAKEGLKAPLPDKWKPYKNSKGDIYYINIGTNEAVYEHPCDEHYRKIFQQCKAKEKMSSSFNKKEKIMIKTTNNKEEILSQKLALPKLNEKQLLNHFQMLNDSFSEHSANLTEKSNSNTEEAINIISEQDMGQIDFEVNNNIIKYKKEKEKEYLSSIKNLEASMIEKEKIIQNNNENNVEKLKEKLAILKEKWQNEKKKYLENLRAGAEIKFDQKIKKEIENFNDLKKIGESNIKIKNKEILECLEDKHKNEINYKKSKVLMRKHEFEKNKIMKKKINEKKAKFLLNKIKDEEKPEIEKEFKENLQIFQEAEMEKKKLTLNSFISKMQEEYQNLLYTLQKDENEEKNRNLVRKKQLKEMYNKRYELEKLSENEKMKAALKFYEIGLKEKLKKKVDNVILNQSIDIKDSINEKNILKFTKSQKKPSGSNFFYEDSSEKINPMSLLDENLKNTKEEIKTSIIDSNDVQIKKIRNEINNLKEIINVSILHQNKKKGGYLSQSKDNNFRRPKSQQKNYLDEKNKREWLGIMIQERNFMNNFKAKFKNTKIILKEAQKNAIYKEKDMKKEMKKYISVRDSSSHMKKQLLKEVKKKFLKNITQISSDIFSLKEQEINLKEKENRLMELENMFNKMTAKSLYNFGELNEIYLKYKQILINEEKIYSVLERKKASSEILSFELEDSDKEENSLLTNDWNELLNDYLVENTNNYELKENNQEIHFPRNDRRVERNYMKSQSYDRHYNERADISNSMQFLKNKLKENTQIHESQHLSLEKYSYQKHLVKCHENNDKVKQLFDNHSSWLKNMRNELNRTLYSKSMNITNISHERNTSFY